MGEKLRRDIDYTIEMVRVLGEFDEALPTTSTMLSRELAPIR
jgi:hypothetical protein